MEKWSPFGLLQIIVTGKNTYIHIISLNERKRERERGRNLILILSFFLVRCGNVAALLELDEHMNKTYKIFEASPDLVRVY